MLIIILVESALEPIPPDLTKYASIKRLAEKKNKKPKYLLLDTSLHHTLMKNLSEKEKRGRPDIVHSSLLVALGSPLYRAGLLNIFVHTRQDKVIRLNPKIRIPKNYNRFVGLIEQLFKTRQVPPDNEALMSMEDMKLKDLITELNPNDVVLFHEKGKPVDLNKFFKSRPLNHHIISLIGGFPHGSFTKDTEKCANLYICIDPELLNTVTVVGETIYSYEQAVDLRQNRFRKLDMNI